MNKFQFDVLACIWEINKVYILNDMHNMQR